MVHDFGMALRRVKLIGACNRSGDSWRKVSKNMGQVALKPDGNGTPSYIIGEVPVSPWE